MNGNKAQLNTLVPRSAKATVKAVAEDLGVNMEELVLDALKLLAGQEDSITRGRARLFKQTCKIRHLKVAA